MKTHAARGLAKLGGLTALAVATVIGGFNLTHQSTPAPDLLAVGDQLISQPTRGDLADDQEYQRQVITTYLRTRDQTPLAGLGVTDHPIGQPHVAWVGNTPAGPAAAVVQRIKLPAEVSGRRSVSNVSDGTGILIKFIGTGPDGQPEAVGTDYFGPDDTSFANSLAFLVGEERSVLVVLDTGVPVEYSLERTYTSTTISRTDWRPLRFRDGAAVVTVPPQLARYSVAIRERQGGAYIGIGNLTDPAVWPVDRGLDWRTPPGDGSPAAQPARFPVGKADPAVAECWHECADETYGKLLAAAQPHDLEPQATYAAGFDWIVYGEAPSGRRFIACDLRIGNDPTRSMLVLEDEKLGLITMYGPPVDRAAPLPVVIKLPGEEGWLVASKGAQLEYRDGSGGWVDAGENAALLPAAATVARANGTEVPLH